jgi:peptidoglycan/LPS O-acetylase OafA/YrhL
MAAPQHISRALAVATFACAVTQLVMVIAGHYNPAIAQQFAVLGVTISLGAGMLYAVSAPDAQRGRAALNGAVAGGVGALIGVIVSFALGDVTASILAIGTLSSAVTGALGGLAGSFVAARRVAA